MVEDTDDKLSEEEKEERLKENFKKIIKEFSSDLKNTFPELVDKLTINYNRSRQASITKELIEIISGAESL